MRLTYSSSPHIPTPTISTIIPWVSRETNQRPLRVFFFFPFPFLWNGWERCTLPLELEAVRTMWAGTPYSHLHSHTKKVFSTRKEWGQWRKSSRAQRRQERGLKLRLASKFSHYVIYLAYICDTILRICIRHIISLVYNAWCACRFVASS